MTEMFEDIKGFLSNFDGIREDTVSFVYEQARKAIRKSSGIKPAGMKFNDECIAINIWDDFADGENSHIYVEDGGIEVEKQEEILEGIVDYLTGKKRKGTRRINVPGSFGMDKKKRKIIWQGGDPSSCRELARRMNDMRLEWMGWDLVFYSES